MWLFERRLIANLRLVEDHKVGRKTLSDLTAVAEIERLGGQGSHLPDRVLERDDLQLANVTTEHSSIVAIPARMGYARSELPDTAVGRDHRERFAHDGLHIVFAHDLVDH